MNDLIVGDCCLHVSISPEAKLVVICVCLLSQKKATFTMNKD